MNQWLFLWKFLALLNTLEKKVTSSPISVSSVKRVRLKIMQYAVSKQAMKYRIFGLSSIEYIFLSTITHCVITLLVSLATFDVNNMKIIKSWSSLMRCYVFFFFFWLENRCENLTNENASVEQGKSENYFFALF